ncbi:MAG TPA: metallophosphoesterase [Bacteroidia bacterium]|nr:metallophosphoesterase [Bacteroidia bacterium]
MTIGLETRTRKYLHWAYWLINVSLIVWCVAIFLSSSPEKGMPRALMTWFGVWVMFFVPKLLIFVVIGVEDVVRGLRAIFALGYNAVSDTGGMSLGISRRQFLSRAVGVIALIPFLGIAHGMIAGRFRYRVRRETLYFDDLPPAFDGFTITQISDIHIGSFDPESHRDEVRAGLALAQEQKSDLFVFTGDLVNNQAEEMLPWKNEFGVLKSPYGQFSILGNHDYGDYLYGFDPSPEKTKNFEQLVATHGEIGFNLMRNQHTVLEKNGEKIYLLGVENWGKGFKQEGKLNLALDGVPGDAFKILLSHDPSHFDEEVSKHESQIHLTLSGHTHGAQFGVEIPGIKWSPVQFRYSRWAGIYNEAKRYLYVNRGFGFLGFPGRVGIWPEVTVLTLKRK